MSRFHYSFVFAAVLVVAMFFLGESRATVRNTSNSWVFGPTPVWSNGSTDTDIFHPLSDPLSSTGVLEVRTSLEMSQNSGYCKIKPAVRYSNDGVSWPDGDKDFGQWRTADGIDFGTTYTDITALGVSARAFVQFGVIVRNVSGSRIETCNATLRVERKQL